MTVDQIKFWAEFYERGVPDDSADKHNAKLLLALADVVEAIRMHPGTYWPELTAALARLDALPEQK